MIDMRWPPELDRRTRMQKFAARFPKTTMIWLILCGRSVAYRLRFENAVGTMTLTRVPGMVAQCEYAQTVSEPYSGPWGVEIVSAGENVFTDCRVDTPDPETIDRSEL